MMRCIGTTFLVLVGLSCGEAESDEGIGAIHRALNWHYTWRATIPPAVEDITCTLTRFEQSALAYCEPIIVALHLKHGDRGIWRVTFISTSLRPAKDVLAEFVGNLGPGPQIGDPKTFSIPAHGLGVCRHIDWETTASLADRLRSSNKAEREMGWTIHYPLVCEGDPFYLVLQEKAESLSAVEYELTDAGPEVRWWYSSNNTGRKPPAKAVENLGLRMFYQTILPDEKP